MGGHVGLCDIARNNRCLCGPWQEDGITDTVLYAPMPSDRYNMYLHMFEADTEKVKKSERKASCENFRVYRAVNQPRWGRDAPTAANR